MGFFRSGLAFILLLSIVTSPAEAATYLTTYTGSVKSGMDQTGELGAAGTSLAGLSFTAEYIFSDDIPGAHVYDDGSLHQLSGGSSRGSPAIISARIRIGSFDFSNTGTYNGYAEKINGIGDGRYNFDYIGHGSEEISYVDNIKTSLIVYNNIFSYHVNFIDSSDPTQSLTYSPFPNDGTDGYFQFSVYERGASAYQRNVFAYLTPETVTVAKISAVPEPASWAIMMIGLGFVGAAMRQRAWRRSWKSLDPSPASQRDSTRAMLPIGG